MSIGLTDELEVKTKKGKLAAAKQIFLEGDKETVQQIGDKTHQLENAIKDITVSGGASTANAVSYNNETSGMTAVTAQGAIDELVTKNKLQDTTIAAKAEKSDVQTSVSELKERDSALSKELVKKANASDVTSKFTEESARVNGELEKKANAEDISAQMQTEKSRVNTELAKKFNSENITQESGEAEDKVMSQKAVSDKLSDLSEKTASQENKIKTLDNYANSVIFVPKIALENKFIEKDGSIKDSNGYYISVPIKLEAGKMIYIDVIANGVTPLALSESDTINADSITTPLYLGKGNFTQKFSYTAKENCYVVVCGRNPAVGKIKIITDPTNTLSMNDELDKKFDIKNIVQESGEAENKVMSQKSVSDKFCDLNYKAQGFSIPGINDIITDKSKITNSIGEQLSQCGLYTFGQGISDAPSYKDNSYPVYKAVITITTNNRPLLVLLSNCLLAASVYRSYAIFDTNGNIIKEEIVSGNKLLIIRESCTILASCGGIYRTDYLNYMNTGSLSEYLKKIVDTNTAITKELEELKKSEGSNQQFKGKTLWTLCDSLGMNTWQPYFVKKTGITFYDTLNTNQEKVITQGGTTTHPKARTGGQARAINLVSYKNTYSMDYVIIENINDSGYIKTNKGSLTDKPYMRSVAYTISGLSLTSYEEAKTYFENNINSFISNFSPKVGALIHVPYTSGNKIMGSKIKFLNTATKEGDISIDIKGKRSIHVTPDMSIQDIIDKFLVWSFGQGWQIIDNGDNSVSIIYYTETSVRATFDGGETGVMAEVTDATGSNIYTRYFISKDVSKWNDISSWSEDISLYSMYKGLLEYLKAELPNTKFYWLIPFAYSFDFTSSAFKNEDGTYSQDKFKESEEYKTQDALFEIQMDVCKYYGVPLIDLRLNSDMSLFNAETFFYEHNVHPKTVGYERYAETIYNIIK